jgi:SAM-dependent methyltransferase
MSKNEQVRRFNSYWDALEHSSRYHPANRYRYHLLKTIVPRHAANAARVLDVGCGDGTLLSEIREVFPRAELVGCDVSTSQIERNRGVFPDMTFVAADASKPEVLERLAAAGKMPFDLVTSSEVIEHVPDDEGFLANLARTVAPGGTVFLTTQSGPRFRMDREVLGHLRHYERKNLEKRVREAGLEIVENFNCGFPILSFQKRAVELAFPVVVRAVASGKEPGWLSRLIMALLYVGLKVSPRLIGPQIVLVARKPR